MNRLGESLAIVVLAAVAGAQTPPIRPQTPDVKLPPPLTLPAPKDLVIGKEPLTADEAVAIALKNQPQIAIAGGNFQIAQGRVQQSRSDLLPSFSASGSYSKSRTFRGASGSSAVFGTSVSVDQLLFDFGRTRDALRQDEALARASLELLNRTNQTVALDVRLAFYDYSQNLQLLAINEQNIANRQRQLDEAQARLDSGLGTPSDVVQAKTNLADAAITLSSTRASALASRVDLAQAMGIDPRTPLTLAPSTETAISYESDVAKLVALALTNRADIRAVQEQVSAARFGVTFAAKGNLPRITASAGLGSRGESDPLTTETGSIGINVTWTFADSGFTQGAVRAAKGSEEIARANLVSLTHIAVSDVSQAYLDLQSALQRVQIAEVGVANAQELVRISEGRFTGGIGEFLDVTNAQSALFSAQRSQIQAQLDVQRTRAQLRTAIGLQ